MGRTQQHHTKAVVVVAVVRLIPVADGTTSVVLIVVPRTAPHDLSRPPDWMLLSSRHSIAEKKSKNRYAAGGGSLPHTPSEAEPSETQSSEHQRAELKNRGRTQQHHTKAEDAVAVVRRKPVADGTTSVVPTDVPRTAPHDPTFVVPRLQILTL